MKKFLTSCLVGDVSSPNDQTDHLGSILDLYQCTPKVLKIK
ncbi:hypothetical protein ACP4OV_010530 [Aristida adscensionis]